MGCTYALRNSGDVTNITARALEIAGQGTGQHSINVHIHGGEYTATERDALTSVEDCLRTFNTAASKLNVQAGSDRLEWITSA